MDEDLKKLRKIAKFAKENGIKSLKVGDIELSFTQETPQKESKQNKSVVREFTKPIGGSEPTDDEMLYWSTGYYDELTGQRKEASL